jgi:Carboxypeptidase regulatory-like domain
VKTALVMLICCLCATGIVLIIGLPAVAADITGVVIDQNGHGVADVHIGAHTGDGKSAFTAVTDARGQYHIMGLEPNTYDFSLDPGKNGFKPGTVASYVSTSGLTVNWRVAPEAEAIATVKDGAGSSLLAADPFGMSAGEFGSAVAAGVGAVAAGVVGGYAAAGGFSGSNNGQSSPGGGGIPSGSQ